MWQMTNVFTRQPVFTMGLVYAALNLATAFGLNLTGVQIGAINLFAASLLTVLVQRVVTPVKAPVLDEGTVVTKAGTEETTTI